MQPGRTTNTGGGTMEVNESCCSEVPAASHLVDVCSDAATWDKRFTAACSENSHQDHRVTRNHRQSSLAKYSPISLYDRFIKDSYSWFCVFPYEVVFLKICEKLCWDFDEDYIESVDCFWYVPCISDLSETFVIKVFWILSKAFSASNEMTICYISLFISDFINLDVLYLSVELSGVLLSYWCEISSNFFMWAFSAVHFPLSTAFLVSHKFGLKSILLDIKISTLACFLSPLDWKVFSQPFTLRCELSPLILRDINDKWLLISVIFVIMCVHFPSFGFAAVELSITCVFVNSSIFLRFGLFMVF
ncbi:hypothetical protein STEG23_021452 [Scotinomys teguina]